MAPSSKSLGAGRRFSKFQKSVIVFQFESNYHIVCCELYYINIIFNHSYIVSYFLFVPLLFIYYFIYRKPCLQLHTYLYVPQLGDCTHVVRAEQFIVQFGQVYDVTNPFDKCKLLILCQGPTFATHSQSPDDDVRDTPRSLNRIFQSKSK